MENPLLSIIIPAHNEQKRLPGALKQIINFLQHQTYSSEVLIVENGSQDYTLDIAQAYAKKYKQCRVFQELNSGKGLAVRRGMLEARGEFRMMCDVDLSMPIAEVNRFLPQNLENFDIAIASREYPGAIRYNEPRYRHWGGRVINILIRLLALPGIKDTQCGFKCFHASVIEDLFGKQTINGWSFDIELLYIARQRSYRIVEVPIPWYFSSETKLSPVRDALQMTLDILTIRNNARRGLYTIKK